ncbi:MAG TPA: flagellar assembly protein FliW [Spirochaetia bacterium]|nr:flagellar assembly protein FliW [Spirochaetia bacterium]
MLIRSKPFGEIEIDDRQRLYFPLGVLGFEGLKDYALMDATQAPFYWLQSLDVQEIAFILIEPRVFRPDYEIAVPDSDLEEIGIESSEQMLVFAIVTVPDDHRQMTANLQGPVLINRARRLGRQSISTDPKWLVRHLILDELAKIRG